MASLLSVPGLYATVIKFTNSYSNNGILVKSVEKGNTNTVDNETKVCDASGRVIQVTQTDSDGKKILTNMEYNDADEITFVKVKEADGSITETEYANHGGDTKTYHRKSEKSERTLVSKSELNEHGKTIEFVYDSKGSKVAQIRYFGTDKDGDGKGELIKTVKDPSKDKIKAAENEAD